MTPASSFPRRLAPFPRLLLLAAALLAVAALVAQDTPPAQAQSTLPRLGFLGGHTHSVLEWEDIGITGDERFDLRGVVATYSVGIESALTGDTEVKLVITDAETPATQGDDYRIRGTRPGDSANTKLLKIPGGQTSASFEVFVRADQKTDPNESISIDLQAIEHAPYRVADGGGYSSNLEILILDDSGDIPSNADSQRGMELNPARQTVAASGTFTYTVSLASQPSANVTITPLVFNRDHSNVNISVSPASGTIAATAWTTALTFTVTAPAQAGRYIIYHFPTSTDDDYAYNGHFFGPGVHGYYLPVTVTSGPVQPESPGGESDFSPPTVSLSAAPNPVDEGSPVRVTVTLSAGFPGDLDLPLVLTRGTSEDGDHGTLSSIFIPALATSATATITTAVDADTDDETFTVALEDALPPFLTAGATSSVTVTIADSTQQQVQDPPPPDPYAALIAQIRGWRDDPCCVNHKPHTDRWDRALLAFGETAADGTLTPMPASEAQTYADRGWTRWVAVAQALQEIEAAAPQSTNSAPTVASAIADVSGLTVGTTREVSLIGVFRDADGDNLTISAASSNSGVASVTVAGGGSRLTLTGAAEGTATITVAARDADGNTVSDVFSVSVTSAPEPTPEPESEDIFARYDTNGDGRISTSELAAALSDFKRALITYAQVLELIAAR